MQSTVAPRSRPIIAEIEGRYVEFASVEAKFDALVAEWRRTYDMGSSTESPINNAYGQIVAMGWEAAPLLLREVKKQSGHWFTALQWITAANVAPAEAAGNYRALREAWLQWGEANGLLP